MNVRPRPYSVQAAISAVVLRSHLDKTYPGAMVASLSVPWGHTGDQRAGYHLVWPRDLVETAGGFIAMGAHEHVRRVLRYLQVTQEPDGHWSQNMWLDGTPYWQGIQMDETALPILLVDVASRNGVLDAVARNALWPMVRKAAVFLARNGPVSPQDRWEEEPGYAPFTIATQIAAMLVAADLADAVGTAESLVVGLLRQQRRNRHRDGARNLAAEAAAGVLADEDDFFRLDAETEQGAEKNAHAVDGVHVQHLAEVAADDATVGTDFFDRADRLHPADLVIERAHGPIVPGEWLCTAAGEGVRSLSPGPSRHPWRCPPQWPPLRRVEDEELPLAGVDLERVVAGHPRDFIGV